MHAAADDDRRADADHVHAAPGADRNRAAVSAASGGAVTSPRRIQRGAPDFSVRGGGSRQATHHAASTAGPKNTRQKRPEENTHGLPASPPRPVSSLAPHRIHGGAPDFSVRGRVSRQATHHAASTA